MRVAVHGPSGVNKKKYLEPIVRKAGRNDIDLKLFNVGDLMYQKRPDIKQGKILDLPFSELNELRRTVLEQIAKEINSVENAILNTHACFRWKRTLFPAFDRELMDKFSPDMYVTIIDDVDVMRARLELDPYWKGKHSLAELMTWRDDELVLTELVASYQSCLFKRKIPHYLIARKHPTDVLYNLMFKPEMKKVYASFPITHVKGMPKTMKEIKEFKNGLKDLVVVFDPLTIKERDLVYKMNAALEDGRRTFAKKVLGRPTKFHVSEIKSIKDHIDGQIVARDYKMIDQSDALIACIPVYPGSDKPVASGGVDSEIRYAHGRTKDVFLVSPVEPSPFILECLSQPPFKSLDELLQYMKEEYIQKV